MAKDLQAWIEGLPEVPRWYHQQIKDGLDVIKHLFANPVLMPCMDFWPYQEFEGPDRQQAYGEFMSTDHAWEIQDKLPPGHSFLGVIGAISLTNIHMAALYQTQEEICV
ncbi:hypothetical protein BDR04DRAFT_1118752 [Suillus decipiens]|nr:hypothetical protein BDR04DRAFT_1118752 [Suillus decipiens]